MICVMKKQSSLLHGKCMHNAYTKKWFSNSVYICHLILLRYYFLMMRVNIRFLAMKLYKSSIYRKQQTV